MLNNLCRTRSADRASDPQCKYAVFGPATAKAENRFP